MNLLGLITVLFISSVQSIALLPSLQGTDWYAGEIVFIQAVQNRDDDGSYYNAYLVSDNLKEKVLTNATYQQWNSFVVPNAFDNAGSSTLYVVNEYKTNFDEMRVVILNAYYYNLRYGKVRGGCADNVFIGSACGSNYRVAGYRDGCGSCRI